MLYAIFSWEHFVLKLRCFCMKLVATAVGSHECAKIVRQAKWLNNPFLKQWEVDMLVSSYSNSWFLVSFGHLPKFEETFFGFSCTTLGWWFAPELSATMPKQSGSFLGDTILKRWLKRSWEISPSLRATEQVFADQFTRVDCHVICSWLSGWRGFECFLNTNSRALSI